MTFKTASVHNLPSACEFHENRRFENRILRRNARDFRLLLSTFITDLDWIWCERSLENFFLAFWGTWQSVQRMPWFYWRCRWNYRNACTVNT
jgi:hypothetical protein